MDEMTDRQREEFERAWEDIVGSLERGELVSHPDAVQVPGRWADVSIVFLYVWDLFAVPVRATASWYDRQEMPLKILLVFFAAFLLTFWLAFHA